MLTFTCEKCGKEFSSETEYNEHCLFEEQKAIMREVMERSSAGWNGILSKLNMMVLFMIDKNYELKGDWEKVIEKYNELNDAWNNYVTKWQAEQIVKEITKTATSGSPEENVD